MRPLGAILLVAFMGSPPYEAGLRQWRERRAASLQAPYGWLSVAGLFWLHEGSNPFGPSANAAIHLPPGAGNHSGEFVLRGGKVTLRADGTARELSSDAEANPDVVKFGDVQLMVIRRGDRVGIRVRDPHSRFRREFRGLRWFPPDEKYRIEARWIADARRIPVLNVLGQTELDPSPGYAEFLLHGRMLRLRPILEEPGAQELFFIFRDRTSGQETYGAGRFLYAPMPRDGRILLDFNKAYSPPCAFTPYATCPLPPPENRLPVRIEAGERAPAGH